MDKTDQINVDSIIARLLEVRGSRPGKAVQLTEAEIRGLCLKVIFELEKNGIVIVKHEVVMYLIVIINCITDVDFNSNGH